MPIPLENKAPFQFGSFYHIYNRSVDGQLLFYNNRSYNRFLDKYKEYLSDVLNLYAFTLIPNHFHLLASVKEEKDCRFTPKELKKMYNGHLEINDIIINRFKNFFISHSLYTKLEYAIKTNVFAQKFKHILIDRDVYFDTLISYIHLNPVKHKLTKDYPTYYWSSYNRLLASDDLLQFDYVLDWFGGKDNFIRYHEYQFMDFEYQYWNEYSNHLFF